MQIASSKTRLRSASQSLLTAAITVALLMSVLASSACAQTVFNDTNMFDSQWSTSYSGSYRSIASARLTGGVIGTGYRFTEVTGFSFQNSVNYRSYHASILAVYNPALSGSISSLNWDVYYNTFLGGHVLRLAAFQDGNVYWSAASETASSQYPFWQHQIVTVTPESFTKVLGTGPAVLNTSSSGTAIAFGYAVYNDSGLPRTTAPAQLAANSGGNAYGQVGVGGYRLAVQSISGSAAPEPSSAALIAPVLLVCGALVRRRKRQIGCSRMG